MQLKIERLTNNQLNLIVWALVGLALFIPCALAAHTHSLSGWQGSLFHTINNMPDSLRKLALVITNALGAVYPIAVCVILPLFFKKYRLAWRFFFTVGGALVVAEVFKRIINEPRPFYMVPEFHQRAIETGPGFPSNHATAATAMALTLWFVLPKKWRFVSVIWILLVMWSRVYLGVHTPVDVIGGFAVGLLAVCFVRLLPKSIAKPLRLDNE